MQSTNKKRKDELQAILLTSTSCSNFLVNAFNYLQIDNKIFNYSELARRGGFASRSHLRQLVLGQKNITWQSLDKICKTFNLSGSNKKYFTLLWEMSLAQDYESKLSKLSKQILGKKTQIDTSLYELENWPLVYASLGNEQTGAALSDIQKRCKLNSNQCEMILTHLEKKELVKKIDNRYYPISNHIALDEMGTDEFFKRYYLKKLDTIRKKTEKNFTSETDLYFQSTTCIPSKKFKMFRQDLRDLLLEYIDTIEDNDGDTTVSLLVSFYEN